VNRVPKPYSVLKYLAERRGGADAINSVLSEVLERPFRGVGCEAEDASPSLSMRESFRDINRGGIVVGDVKGSASTRDISVRRGHGLLGYDILRHGRGVLNGRGDGAQRDVAGGWPL